MMPKKSLGSRQLCEGSWRSRIDSPLWRLLKLLQSRKSLESPQRRKLLGLPPLKLPGSLRNKKLLDSLLKKLPELLHRWPPG